MLEITCNDRLGKKVRVKCNGSDTIGDLKKLIAAQTGTRADKIVLKKCNDQCEKYQEYLSIDNNTEQVLALCVQLTRYTIFKDHITIEDYEIHDGFNIELYYQ